MPAATSVPIEAYLRSSWEPDAEYVDGTIEERPTGEYDHAAWQAAVLKWFWQHEREWNIRALPELRVQAAPARFRVPDVIILDRNRPVEQIVTHAPLAVFEILSPEDTVQRLRRKLEDYSGMGIAQIWIVDPQDGSLSRYSLGQMLQQEDFSIEAMGVSFQVGEIAALLD